VTSDPTPTAGSSVAYDPKQPMTNDYSTSAKKLRPKSGKTMVAKSVAGHRKSIAEAMAMSETIVGQTFPAQVLPDLQRRPSATKKPLC